MNLKATLKLLVLSMLLLPALAVADNHNADGFFEKTVALDRAVLLDVDTGSGSIKVTAGSDGQASISGKIKVRRKSFWRKAADKDEIVRRVIENPPIELSDGQLKIGYLRDRDVRKRVSISYEIVVPADTEVIADTGSGSILIRDIAAPVEADTGSGAVNLMNISGSVKADTGSGSIRAENIAGNFDGDTGSGGIYVSQRGPGDVLVSTGSGSTELVGISGAVRASAGSGGIKVEGRQEGRWKLSTGSGSITVSLPDDAAFELDAETNSGSINVEHPITTQHNSSKKHVKGTVRGGGHLLRIDTGSGGIRVN